MLDFFEGLKKKPDPKKASSKPESEAAAAPAAIPVKKPALEKKTEDMAPAEKPVEKVPRIFAVKAGEKKAEAKGKPNPPRPRPIRTGHGKTLRPLLFKLLIGVGVASAAVAMQDKLPRFESRGAGVVSATTKSGPAVPEVRPLAQLKGHIGAVTAVAYTEDGSWIVTAGQDATIRVWNASSDTLQRTIELDNGPATSLALSGSRALTGHSSGEIVLWDLERAEKIATFKRNEAEVWSVTFAGRSDRFAASSHDWKVALWDTATTAGPIQVIDAHENAAQAVAYSSSARGQLLATGGADKTVKLWNLDTLDRVRTYRGHRDFVTALAFSPDGKLLASAGLDGPIRIWSTSSSRLVRRLYGHKASVGGLAFSPQGDLLVSAGADGQVRIWDFHSGRTSRTIMGHTGGVKAVSVSPDGQRIASAGDDGIVRLWANPIQRPVTN
jgi:WD40 repeat protein